MPNPDKIMARPDQLAIDDSQSLEQELTGVPSPQFEYVDLQPWERQPDESPQAYALFAMYRDMPPDERGYGSLAKRINKNPQRLGMFGSDHRWVERAAAWDFHLERARLAATESHQIEMALRHAELSKSMLDKLTARLNTIELARLGPKEIAQWLEVGVKVERLSRGLKDEAVAGAIGNNGNVKTLSDQELLAELAREGLRRRYTVGKVLDAIPATEKGQKA